ncbi:Outer membrane lipoprotein carrier protein LolA [Methylophaga thiooxydans]|uniref:Outer-membrane lipoprotein carrier protein n=1 Tax=Methylophaga thiooxydans TaxID=392484 RepID=A0A0A0BD43_9GAMM|nr:outer membrane lipoprotein chaperone LolA [Methylophaga thiooxydans]KGM05871.1 Outer membrane lipoprotein carrier protein LolA [Methylophaga thiooxydans]
MTMKQIMAGLFLSLLLVTGLSQAQSTGEDKLNQFVQHVETFQAAFEQTVIDPEGQVMEQAQGLFVLSRPGKFRWDYETPYPQKIVADGKNIWFYDVDLEQVTVKSQQEALAETPATLLSGELVPEDKYNINNLPSDDGLLWVELTPKQTESNFQAVTLAFDGDVLQQMIMRDSFDQRTRLTFTQVIENPKFKQDMFKFTPPTGIDVVGEAQQ